MKALYENIVSRWPVASSSVILVSQLAITVAMVSVFAARHCKVKNIVLTGNLTRLAFCKTKFNELNAMYGDVHFVIPEACGFGTAIGAALAQSKDCSEI